MKIYERIGIGSRNPIKVAAVEEVLASYNTFKGARYLVQGIDSGVADQPFSLEETIKGAYNRARGAARALNVEAGVGIESGIMRVAVPLAADMLLDVCACVIWYKDTQLADVGTSGAWALPPAVADILLKTRHRGDEALNLTEACIGAGLTEKADLGDREGAIGVLTHGRITRKDYTMQAIHMALVGQL